MQRELTLLHSDLKRRAEQEGVERVLQSATSEEERSQIRMYGALVEATKPSYLHSALCATSLPIRKPKDDTKPIIRVAGEHHLMMTPRPYLDKEGKPVFAGVPYGSIARLILIFMMSEAVKNQNPRIYLGQSLRHWMARLGYQNFSGGPRGTYTAFKDQALRLARLEWTIRREINNKQSHISDVRLAKDLMLWETDNGPFSESIELAPEFFQHLLANPVALNEAAIRHLRGHPFALDVYTFLVYQLPNLDTDVLFMSWRDLHTHFGTSGSFTRFKQSFAEAWGLVSQVYPEARLELVRGGVNLFRSPAAVIHRADNSLLRIVD